jgi:acetoin utilization protein AcuB
MNAQDIMTVEVVSIPREETLGRAMAMLAELDVRHLPVVHRGELVGMLSDRDLREAGLFHVAEDAAAEDRLRELRRMPVADAMNSDVVSIDPSTTVPEIVELMIEERVGALPVVEEHTNTLVGIVSYVDVLRVAADALAD